MLNFECSQYWVFLPCSGNNVLHEQAENWLEKANCSIFMLSKT